MLHLPKKRQALLKQGTCPGVLTLLIVEQSQGKERPGDTIPITQLFEECEILLHQYTRCCKVASSPGRHAESVERERDTSSVSKLPEQRQALLGKHLSLVIVALVEGEPGGGKRSLCPYVCCNSCA